MQTYQRIINRISLIFNRLRHLTSRARQIYSKEGFKELIKRTKSFLFLKRYYNKKDLAIESLLPAIKLEYGPVQEKSVAYLLFNYECCGGNRVIFEQANRLAERGWNVFLPNLLSNSPSNWFDLSPQVKTANFYEFKKWLPKIKAIVATYHITLKYILDLPLGIKKFYFVQSDERKFYDAVSLEYFECEETYRVPGINLFSGARWLKERLKKEFNQNASFVPGKVNFEHFFPEKKIHSDKPIVLVEGNLNYKYKGVQDAYEGIKDLNCEKWLLTNSTTNLPLYTKGFDKIWSVPPQNVLRQVISSADILIKPSYFEGSPLCPMEAMTCGTAVIIANHLGGNEYCIEGYNSLKFMPGDIEGLKQVTQRLISDSQLRNELITNGLQFAKQNFDYKEAIDILENILLSPKENGFSVSFKEFKQSTDRRYLNWLKSQDEY